MRTTRIFFRRTRVLNAFFLGGLSALVLCVPIFGAVALSDRPTGGPVLLAAAPQAPQPDQQLAEAFGDLRIATYGRLAGDTVYVFRNGHGDRITAADLAVKGIAVKDRGPREALLVRDADYHSVFR